MFLNVLTLSLVRLGKRICAAGFIKRAYYSHKILFFILSIVIAQLSQIFLNEPVRVRAI